MTIGYKEILRSLKKKLSELSSTKKDFSTIPTTLWLPLEKCGNKERLEEEMLVQSFQK